MPNNEETQIENMRNEINQLESTLAREKEEGENARERERSLRYKNDNLADELRTANKRIDKLIDVMLVAGNKEGIK